MLMFDLALINLLDQKTINPSPRTSFNSTKQKQNHPPQPQKQFQVEQEIQINRCNYYKEIKKQIKMREQIKQKDIQLIIENIRSISINNIVKKYITYKILILKLSLNTMVKHRKLSILRLFLKTSNHTNYQLLKLCLSLLKIIYLYLTKNCRTQLVQIDSNNKRINFLFKLKQNNSFFEFIQIKKIFKQDNLSLNQLH
eukprot:TRINITY_DN5438_c0_g1_i2.p1 TRINITY_DN5438_c0_g1~~TRINITY_DN5438_c0_g1_i2.p1  ORF type:complete len:198 (+),score=-13.54 TRINITY_DN5438_c0_g1_i2:133-726(+)